MKNCAGFSLVEIAVAMVILAGVGAMTMSAFTNSAQVSQPGANDAYNFGRGIVEKMHEFVRADQWATAALPLSTTNPGTGGVFTPQNSTKSVNGNTFTAAYTVTAQNLDADNTQDDLRKVKVTITW